MSDQIQFACSQCNTTLAAAATSAGLLTVCPTCQAKLTVPFPVQPVAVPPAPVVAVQVPARKSGGALPGIQGPPARNSGGALPGVVAPAAKRSGLVPSVQPQASSEIKSAAMGSEIAADPNAADPAKALGAARPRGASGYPRAVGGKSGYPRAVGATGTATGTATAPRKEKAPSASSRKPMMMFSAVIVVGIAGVAGFTIKNNMERAQIESDVKALVADAQKAFTGNEIEKAFKLATEAKTAITKSPQPLTPELKKGWEKDIEKINKVKLDLDELKKIFATAENDLFNVRARLSNKRDLLDKNAKESQALIAELDRMLGEIVKLEEKRKLKGLQTELAAADARYKEGEIEDAGEKALKILDEMKKKPVIQDKDIEGRIDVLKKRAIALKQAKDVRMSARNGNYAEAKQKLQQQLSGLDEQNPDFKPLISRIQEIRTALAQDEKRSKALSNEDATELKGMATILGRTDNAVVPGSIEGDTVGLRFDNRDLRLGILDRSTQNKRLFLESNGYRFAVSGRDILRRSRRVFHHVLKLADAMKKAGVTGEEVWNAEDEAPLPSARRIGADSQEYVFLGDKLYVGKPVGKDRANELTANFVAKTEALAAAIEKDSAPEEIRNVVIVAIRAAAKDADWHDHLPGEFVRKVVNEGYVENNMPGAGERLKKELADWRDAYTKASTTLLSFSGQDADGNEATESRNFEDHATWRLYDKKADTTTFAIKNPDNEKDSLFILYDFPGKLTDLPKTPPAKLRMTHQAAGVTASYDMAAQKFDYDRDAWNLSAEAERGLIPQQYVRDKGLGNPEWALPPHVLMVDIHGNTQSIITPFGKLDVVNFNAIEAAKRDAAIEEFLGKMAKVLPSAGYLHLYFRYMHEYILDSPHTGAQALLGSRSHSGDIHQTAQQSLCRFMGGRFCGDCDDLAELFVNVTRRQNKLSYVMALPGHAACGWAEKPEGESEYTFYVIDTGPPRMFRHKELDKVIEMACRAYDEDKTMRFDPKSLGFLFRFNGEQTRSPYYLSSRMYVDKNYGETMETVQSFWHFHFYALGIQKMTEMIEKGDRVPENCIELAGLYGQCHEFEQSIKWTQEALKQVKPHEKLSRMNEEMRIGMMWREARENEKSFEAVKHLMPELKQLNSDPSSLNYLNIRMQLMGLLTSIDRPWDAWDVVIRDIDFIAQRGALRIEHVGGITTIYKKMRDLERGGRALTPAEKAESAKLETLLKWFYTNAVFQREDDFNDYMRKYAFIGEWYAAQHGNQKLVEELLKPGPFPDLKNPRNHGDRRNPEEEDWKWIRLALPSYAMAMGEALDPEEPPEKWRKEEAVKLADAMVRASEECKKFGSLSGTEYQLFAARVTRAFLKKDWAELEAVLKITQERNWARLTSDIAETIGRNAKFVAPQEFASQYRLFAKYIKARTAYFTVVYEAYRADAPEQAVAAAKIASELHPGDEDMKREVKFLEELAKKKAARKAAKAPK